MPVSSNKRVNLPAGAVLLGRIDALPAPAAGYAQRSAH